ncbi:hypothetical protein [Candidatus Methanocrinis natronophilus]|uniref:5-bromo-4-chloroindolyl phosphate hydrolysis protein n=1 Tax=Candidatus Methanocrinis natronophilus TaxID=3033396 RepID=A0ABT5X905_9EURY|nr:hypothetical protein [Candidatus Methanocrinis natronophilus]MDF0591160.1 hypothetical protein [Candidatus Methanocrinis natronophilus]
MDRERKIKLLGLNLGVAAANIIIFSPAGLIPDIFAASKLIATFGISSIILSGAGLIYGNYILLKEPERSSPTRKIMTSEDYVERLEAHRRLKTFERNVDILLDQIDRLQNKNRIIRNILLQIFSASEMSYKKFDGVIAEVERIFFMNLRSILNKMNAFDEEDYNFVRERRESRDFSEEFMEEKIKVYNEYITFVKSATEDNEQILLKLDKLLLEISGLNSVESGQLEEMAGMREIDDLIKQAKNYRN